MGWWQATHNAFGFTRGYNFIYYIITIGALMGFSLARFEYLSFKQFCSNNGASSAAPGECYYYMFRGGHYKVGIQMHLAAIVPAAFLVCFQFTPVIRHKFRLFHKINGYIIIILIQFSTAGALMIARRAFGGTLATQAAIGFLAILSTTGITLAYINVKRLQIDQHRAWMIRTWAYMASSITTRIIIIITAEIITGLGDYYYAMPCDKLEWLIGSQSTTVKLFPECQAMLSGQTTNTDGSVLASMKGGREQIAAAFDTSFGMALWVALAIHAGLAEIYLSLTRGETARLRQYSYERQLAAGFKNPGYAGITFDRLRDERWSAETGEVGVDARQRSSALEDDYASKASNASRE